MACGAFIRDAYGAWLFRSSTSYDHGNSYLAEVLDVELGLLFPWNLGLREVLCVSDCKNVVVLGILVILGMEHYCTDPSYD